MGRSGQGLARLLCLGRLSCANGGALTLPTGPHTARGSRRKPRSPDDKAAATRAPGSRSPSRELADAQRAQRRLDMADGSQSRKLRFEVAFVSGQDPEYPASELNVHSPETRGWASPQ